MDKSHSCHVRAEEDRMENAVRESNSERGMGKIFKEEWITEELAHYSNSLSLLVATSSEEVIALQTSAQQILLDCPMDTEGEFLVN